MSMQLYVNYSQYETGHPWWFKMIKCLPAMRETQVWSLGRKDTLEKEMAIHSSILAWKIAWTEEPRRLQSMGSHRVRHDWATSLFFHFLGLSDFTFLSLSRSVIAFLPRRKHILISCFSHCLHWFWSPRKYILPLFPFFPHLFVMKWWDQMLTNYCPKPKHFCPVNSSKITAFLPKMNKSFLLWSLWFSIFFMGHPYVEK